MQFPDFKASDAHSILADGVQSKLYIAELMQEHSRTI
jgi:hypothetical protein